MVEGKPVFRNVVLKWVLLLCTFSDSLSFYMKRDRNRCVNNEKGELVERSANPGCFLTPGQSTWEVVVETG